MIIANIKVPDETIITPDKLKDCNTTNYGDFINFIIKSGKTLSTLTLLGFAGLSVYDLLLIKFS